MSIHLSFERQYLERRREIVERIRRREEAAAARRQARCLVTDFGDGEFFAGTLQTVNGQGARTLMCAESLTVAFHTGLPGEDRVNDSFHMPNGCEVRRGEDCTVKCVVVEIIDGSQLLYVERKTIEGPDGNQMTAWYLRRSRKLRPTSGNSVGRRSRGHGPDRSL